MTLVDQFKMKMASDMIARANGGNDVWPAPIVDLDASVLAIAPFFLSNISEALSQLTLSEAAACFKNPSAVAQLMYLFMDRPTTVAQGHDRLKVAEGMLEIVDHLRSGDGLCTRGANRLFSEPLGRQLKPVDPDAANQLGRLIALLGLYCEYTYFAFTGFGREVHGPYGESPSIIVRDYLDLTPTFWDFPRYLGFDRLSLHIAYDDLIPSFDFMGRLLVTDSLPGRTTAAALSVDESEVNITPRSVASLIDSVSRALSAAQLETLAMSEDQLFRQLVHAIYWSCREIFGICALDHLAPVSEEVLSQASKKYSSITRKGHSPLSLTLQHIGRLAVPDRGPALQRLVDPAELGKYICVE